MKKINIIFGISILLLLGALLTAYFAFINNSHVIALHFDAIRGIDYFGTRTEVFYFLFVAFVINFTNAAVSKFLYNRENFLALIVAVANAVFMVLILVATIVMVINN